MVQCPKVRRALWVLGGVLHWEAQTEADAAAQLSESKLGNMHPLVASVCGIDRACEFFEWQIADALQQEGFGTLQFVCNFCSGWVL